MRHILTIIAAAGIMIGIGAMIVAPVAGQIEQRHEAMERQLKLAGLGE